MRGSGWSVDIHGGVVERATERCVRLERGRTRHVPEPGPAEHWIGHGRVHRTAERPPGSGRSPPRPRLPSRRARSSAARSQSRGDRPRRSRQSTRADTGNLERRRTSHEGHARIAEGAAHDRLCFDRAGRVAKSLWNADAKGRQASIRRGQARDHHTRRAGNGGLAGGLGIEASFGAAGDVHAVGTKVVAHSPGRALQRPR